MFTLGVEFVGLNLTRNGRDFFLLNLPAKNALGGIECLYALSCMLKIPWRWKLQDGCCPSRTLGNLLQIGAGTLRIYAACDTSSEVGGGATAKQILKSSDCSEQQPNLYLFI